MASIFLCEYTSTPSTKSAHTPPPQSIKANSLNARLAFSQHLCSRSRKYSHPRSETISGIDFDSSYTIKSSIESNVNLLSCANNRLLTDDFPDPRPPMIAKFLFRPISISFVPSITRCLFCSLFASWSSSSHEMFVNVWMTEFLQDFVHEVVLEFEIFCAFCSWHLCLRLTREGDVRCFRCCVCACTAVIFSLSLSLSNVQNACNVVIEGRWPHLGFHFLNEPWITIKSRVCSRYRWYARKSFLVRSPTNSRFVSSLLLLAVD